jgi:hypothetical protein
MNKRKFLGVAVAGLTMIAIAGQAVAVSLSDIKGSPYQTAIEYWVENGVIHGYPDGTYQPLREINRAEFLKIILGATGEEVTVSGNCFPDVKADWYAPYVCQAKNKGIVQGYPDGYFYPDRTINYVEALKILYLANGDAGGPSGTAWYSPYTNAAEQSGVALSGISYAQLMSRGQIAQLAFNYRFRLTKPQDGGSTGSGGDAEGGSDDGNDAGTGSGTDSGSTGSDTGTDTGSGGTTQPPIASAGNAGPRACSGVDPADGVYVSPSGNDDTADGSIGAPYKSINTALAAAEPGDTVILRGGTYREGINVRIRQPNITLKSKNGEWAVIDLTDNYEEAAVYFDVDSSGGKLQCVEVKGGFYAFATETRWDWGEASRAGASNIVIEDSKLHSSSRDVIKIKPNSDNITIRYNEIYNSGVTETFGDCNAEGIDNVNGDGMKVQNNYIHDICSNAVYAKGGAADALIENNRIERAGSAGILVGFDTSPEFFDLTVNPNYFENIRGTVRNNLIVNTGLSGIGLYAAKDAQVYNNTLVNVANGDYHSAIYFGITFQDWEDYAGRPANVNPTIYNNIVSQPSGITRPMVEIRYSNELGGLSALDGMPTMSNNCYYIAGQSARFSDRRPGSTLEDAGLTAWQAHIGGDSGSLEVDPGLGSDYLPASAQCAGRGYQK